jgi:hypothetical protein
MFYNALSKQIGSYRRMVSASSMDNIEARDEEGRGTGTDGGANSDETSTRESAQSAADRMSEASMKLSSMLSQKGWPKPELSRGILRYCSSRGSVSAVSPSLWALLS